MNISPQGIAFIKSNEGFSAMEYMDDGHRCIGYGCDLPDGVSFPNGISEAAATEMLVERVQPLLATIERLFPAANQDQVDALCDFGYNLGDGALQTMMAHGITDIAQQMMRWDYNEGKPDAALLARRAREVALFNA